VSSYGTPLLVTLLGLVSVWSCVAVRGGDQPQAEGLRLADRSNAVAVQYHAVVSTVTASYGARPLASKFHEEIRSVLYDSGFFKEPAVGADSEPYALQLLLEKIAPAGTASALRSYGYYATGITLLVIPFYDRWDYELIAEIRRPRGDVRVYRYHSHMNIWLQFPLLLPLTPFFTLDKTERKVIDDLLVQLLLDLQRDGSLSTPRLATTSPSPRSAP
jgi:hypothetical protein